MHHVMCEILVCLRVLLEVCFLCSTFYDADHDENERKEAGELMDA